ncbi:MAG: esterase, partial [Solirubrobacterales bacterium]
MGWTSTFRSTIATAIMCAVPTLAQTPQRPPQIVSPEILPDHRVTFRIQAPKASEITLWGDWMGSSPAEKLTKGEQDVWSVTVGPLVPDQYCYSFTVDGVKTFDPRNPSINQGISGSDSMFFLPGEEAAFEDNQPVPHGEFR